MERKQRRHGQELAPSRLPNAHAPIAQLPMICTALPMIQHDVRMQLRGLVQWCMVWPQISPALSYRIVLMVDCVSVCVLYKCT